MSKAAIAKAASRLIVPAVRAVLFLGKYAGIPLLALCSLQQETQEVDRASWRPTLNIATALHVSKIE